METTVTRKGQVTIPRTPRTASGLKPRDRRHVALYGDRDIPRRADAAILAGYGSVTPPQPPEDLRRVREEVERAIAAEVAAETVPSQ